MVKLLESARLPANPVIVRSFFRQNIESLPEGIFDGLGEVISV